MLKKLILENWKSFRYAELPIDPLTVLIGTNASGKSNAIEALEVLRRVARAEEIKSFLIGDTELSAIRGGAEWAATKSKTEFTLESLVQGEVEGIDYLYSITIKTTPKVQLTGESLVRIEYQLELDKEPNRTDLYRITDIVEGDSPIAFISYSGDEFGRGKGIRTVGIDPSSTAFLASSFAVYTFQAEVTEAFRAVIQALLQIFILDPVPSKMRSYSSLSEELLGDASNIAGVLAALPDEKKVQIEATISSYVAHLPERDIQKVWAEKVGRLGSDAMLYCEESWVPGEPPMVVDARGMSDGTLRFLAILTALLTRPEGSQLVIEEVDSGLHPSRAGLLLKILQEIGSQRNIYVLVTTHNPALLDALGLKMTPFVVVAHRDPETGESKLTPLDDVQHLPKLLASGSIGDLATQGKFEEVLSRPN